MHEYDFALKRIITRPGSALLRALTGHPELRWLNVELPTVTNLRVDLLGELPDGELVHFEFQSKNERRFPFRMAEYLFAIGKRYGRLPRQIVLYVGEKPLRMTNGISSTDLMFRFHMVDARDLDGESLLASDNIGDNVIAVLTSLGREPGTLRRILKRIATGPAVQRDEALTELTILAGLRRLTGELEVEVKTMPITEKLNLMENPLIGHIVRKMVADEQIELLLGMAEKRFGKVPARVRKQLASLDLKELKAASLRLLDAQRVEDLFAK